MDERMAGWLNEWWKDAEKKGMQRKVKGENTESEKG